MRVREHVELNCCTDGPDGLPSRFTGGLGDVFLVRCVEWICRIAATAVDPVSGSSVRRRGRCRTRRRASVRQRGLLRPFHAGPAGPTTRPAVSRTTPECRSCTYSRKRSLVASSATLGRRARRSACHCATDGLYSRRHVRVDAFRRNSRERLSCDYRCGPSSHQPSKSTSPTSMGTI
jgi:hypothetical protein